MCLCRAPAKGFGSTSCLPTACTTPFFVILQAAEVQALPRIVAKRWPGAHINIVVNSAGAQLQRLARRRWLACSLWGWQCWREVGRPCAHTSSRGG